MATRLTIMAILAALSASMVGGCASPASHFNADIVNSGTACKGQSFKTEVGLIQCYGSAERPIVLKDLPNIIDAYDLWHSARLSAASDYDNQVKSAREQALAIAKQEIDRSEKRLNKSLIGIWPQAKTEADSIKQEAEKSVDSQCKKDGIWKSMSYFKNQECNRDARLPIFEKSVPAATNALLIHYDEVLAIASVYDNAVQSAIQAASAKFNETIGPAKGAFRSGIQLALQEDAAATARQRQEIADDAGTVLMLLGAGLSGFNQARGYGQPSSPPISTSCTTTNEITNCLSF